ncbi:MAG: DUF2079 domain membrane protein [Candidatus Daviesbacteria bacterium GW2011_GWB1_39_5]|nr:MAG: DUF2079 domain membrane protein [Candidatus Daviesbacteria bacterium GW2011_GWB1_39_5]
MAQRIIIPSLLAALFIVIFSLHTLNRHFSFNSHAFDLGIHTQATYLYSQGLTPFSTLKHMLILADHFGLILLLISPLYKLFPDASTLLILQAIFVALSCIPIYAIAQDRLKNTLVSFLIALSYLTSQGIISAVNFDFHLATISVLPLSLILYFWYFKKWRMYWIILALSLTFKEDIPIFILGLGLFQIIKREIKLGLLTVIFALVSVYIIKFQIMPFLWAGASSAYLSASILPINQPLDLILLILTRPSIFTDQLFNSPIKMQTVDELYRSFDFLPVLSILSWLTVFPSLFLRFSSTYIQTWTNNFHHSANLIPFLAVSSIFALSKFNIPLRPVIILFIFFLFTGGLAPNGLVWGVIKNPIQDISHLQYIQKSLQTISSSASVSAQSPIIPHLANREQIFFFPEVFGAEYIVLDSSLSSYPMNPDSLKERIATFKKSNYWKIKLEDRSLIIFQRR